ncbi:MAG: glycerol-3-phosphate responsive antiterminator [Sulfobacillus sp.]|nr:glycerol-3-phosphate responsive antiterminator [Sulfobacillus sp.]
MPTIIPALRRLEDIPRLPPGDGLRWVFMLGGTLSTVPEAVRTLHQRGWRVFVHVDMLRGLTADGEGLKFLQQAIRPEGIITTHSQTVTQAKKVGLFTIQRIFLLDSQSVATGVAQVRAAAPDAVETLPGILPGITRDICRQVTCPVIAGGLIQKPEQVETMLAVGAASISTSTPTLWHWQRGG